MEHPRLAPWVISRTNPAPKGRQKRVRKPAASRLSHLRRHREVVPELRIRGSARNDSS